MLFDLKDKLSRVLSPSPSPYRLLNLQSIPKESRSIVHHHKKDHVHTFKAVHFFVLFVGDKPVIALEVYVYLDVPELQDNILRTVYISKADTSGLTDQRIPVGAVIRTLLEWLLLYPIREYMNDVEIPVSVDRQINIGKDHEPFVSETDRGLHILVERARGNKGYGMPVMVKGAIFKPSERLLSDPSRHSTRLILFTRSEAQYLFPNSSKNRGKHILSDSGLLKWWLKNVEVILGSGVFGEVQKRKLNILNADQNEVSRYFPSKESGWQVGDVYSDGKGLNEVAVYHIPLLPDDPKGRFLEHLVVENRIKKVRLRQFWTELSIRQEFRLGITVGLIGIEGQSNENDGIDSGVHKFKRAEFNKIKDLIVNIDYSDPLDYRNANKQLEERELDLLEIKGVASTSHIAPSSHSLVPTLLPTRSKRGLSEVHVISTLVKRKVKK